MKYAISNIAWKPVEKKSVYALMKEYSFFGLEIAPSLFMNNSKSPYDESKNECKKAKLEAETYGLSLVSMQALLFGASELYLFKSIESRERLFDYCKKAIDFSSVLKIPNLVFGSPKNRIIPDSMKPDEAHEIAFHFFKKLGDYAFSKNTCVAMEANSKKYGGNYVTTTNDAIDLVRQVDSEGFKLNLDMGTMNLEDENLESLNIDFEYVNHIHISEAFLSPIYKGNIEIHRRRAAIIKNSNYKKYLSIEMKFISENNNLDHVKYALEFIRKTYES